MRVQAQRAPNFAKLRRRGMDLKTQFFALICGGVISLTGCVKPPVPQTDDMPKTQPAPQVIKNTGAPIKAAALDIATDTQRKEATDSVAESDLRLLGTAVATLGNPAETGFWVKTSLVSTQTQGRITFVETGESVNVTLIARDGDGEGAEVSLSALRTLNAPLAGLIKIEIYSKS